MARPRMRWEDEVKLEMASGGEEWMTIQNAKIWKTDQDGRPTTVERPKGSGKEKRLYTINTI